MLVIDDIELVRRIQRNRERLLALGIPSLSKKLHDLNAITSLQKPSEVQKAKKKAEKKKSKQQSVSDSAATRRSTRLQGKVKQEEIEQQQESTEEKFKRELGVFIVEGTCPKCGKVYQKGHRRHLLNCAGPKRPSTASGYSKRDKELLADLTEEERMDERKRMIARTKALALDGLVNFDKEEATFIVIGSRGDPYVIKLNDIKRTCTCLDHRFRRHDCKHILLVLSQLEILEEPEKWHSAVGKHLGEIARKKEDRPAETQPGMSKEDEIAHKFL